ncbi:MAG: hypothetical protein ACFFBP_13345 [Promethearchaeota archaeon]
MFEKIKSEVLNFGLKFISIDEKIVRIFLETRPSNVNEIVILPAVKNVMKSLISKLKNKSVHGRVYNGYLNGVKVSIIRSLVGSPNAAIAVESLKRCTTKIIIRVDLCGGISNDKTNISIGDILIPKMSYCGDGTSPQYILKFLKELDHLKFINNPDSKALNLKIGNEKIFISEPDQGLNNIILNEANIRGLNRVNHVDFWTTDALFCETEEFIASIKSIGVQGIDMENSVLFLLSKFYDIKSASILSVSDLPCHPKYDLFNSNILHPDMETGMKRAIDLLVNSLPKIKSNLI